MQFLIGRHTTQVTENRFSDPAEFEKEFTGIMGDTRDDKIVIAFDNLDRVTENKAVEVLSTIKTFLEPKFEDKKRSKSIIFLIPCDNNAIQKHIKRVYFLHSNGNDKQTSQDKESEEFLNKFFNCTVTIPEFIPSEFETYTLSLLEKSGIPQFQSDNQIKNDVTWIIVQAYRNNPRRLIHFINSLSAYYIHILNRIIAGEFEMAFLENSLPQITKYLVIEKKFPETLKTMKERGYGNPQKFADSESGNQKEFQDFIHATRDIEIDNIYLFSHRRLSKSEKKFPGIHILFDLMEQEDRDGLLEHLENLNVSKENEQDFSNGLKDELEKKKIQQSKANFINSLLYIKANASIAYKHELYTTIYNKIEDNYDILRNLSPSLVFEELIQSKTIPRRTEPIENYWIDQFPAFELPFLKEVLDLIFCEKLQIPKQKKETYFENLLKLPLEREEIVSMICNLDPEKQIRFLNEALIEKMITSNVLVGAEGDLSRLNQISPHLISISSINSIEENLKYIREKRFDNLSSESKHTFIQEYTKFLRNNTENYRLLHQKSEDRFNQFIEDNLRFFRRTPYESLPIHVELAILADKNNMERLNNNLKSEIINLLSTDPKRLQSALDAETIKRIYELDKNIIYRTSIHNRKETLFVLFYRELGENEKLDLLNQAFKFDVHYGLSVYKILIQEQTETMTPESLRICLDNFSRNPQGFNHTEQTVVLRICNETRCFDDPELKKEYVNLIKIILASKTDQTQKTDYISILQENTFLLPEDLRAIIKDTHTKLIRNEISPEPILLKFISSKAEDTLNSEERDQLIQLLFDQIRDDNHPTTIKKLFEYLSGLKPRHDKREKNFLDIKQKIESSSGDLKGALIDGILLLKSGKDTSEKSKTYWESIENLKSMEG